jgi:hypothetical protein
MPLLAGIPALRNGTSFRSNFIPRGCLGLPESFQYINLTAGVAGSPFFGPKSLS